MGYGVIDVGVEGDDIKKESDRGQVEKGGQPQVYKGFHML